MSSLTLALVFAAGIAGCSATPRRLPDGPRTPTVVLDPDGGEPVRVHVELARTDDEKQRGLMYRSRLDPDGGMLFLFDRETHQVFWMRNTYVPLDMIFISKDRRVVGVVEHAEPLTDTPRSVEGLSQYVLEVEGGFAAQHRIGGGTRVQFVDVD
jgi:uncharacterized membrane protein (UPF0127 family)